MVKYFETAVKRAKSCNDEWNATLWGTHLLEFQRNYSVLSPLKCLFLLIKHHVQTAPPTIYGTISFHSCNLDVNTLIRQLNSAGRTFQFHIHVDWITDGPSTYINQRDNIVHGLFTMSSLSDFEARVSSVLNRNVKEYGKKFLFDGREDTCWNSEQGTPQWIQVSFDSERTVSGFAIQFQGGFAGKNCWIEASKDGAEFSKQEDFYPEDMNKAQRFELQRPCTAKCFKFVFSESTDFFGRITVYQLQLF